MAENINWSSKMLSIVHSLNSFHHDGSSQLCCKPFIVDGKILGQVPPYVFQELENFKDVFSILVDSVRLHESLKSPEERTQKIQLVMESLRGKSTICSLKGWRNEMYNVCKSFSEKPLFQMERAAVSLFGVQQYGVHLNGYKRDHNGLHMWIARRSFKKPTYPGKLDQLAAGGIAAGDSIEHTLIKECQEEACIPESLAKLAIPVGAVSYCYEDERGIFPEVEFVYDLEVPANFEPSIGDGEVEEFFCWPINKVKERIASGEFKPNCAIIILDFLIRHGVIQPDNDQARSDIIRKYYEDNVTNQNAIYETASIYDDLFTLMKGSARNISISFQKDPGIPGSCKQALIRFVDASKIEKKGCGVKLS